MNTENSNKQFFVLAAALCFSTTGLIQAHAPHGANPFVIGSVRMVVAGLFLFFWTIYQKKLYFNTDWDFKFFISGVLPATLGLLCYQLCFFEGLLHAGVAVGTVVAIGVSPIFTAILGMIFFKERPKNIWYLATGISIIGLLLINLDSIETINFKSIIFPMSSGFGFAVYLISSKKLVKNNPPELIMTVLFCLGGIFTLPIFFIFPSAWIFTLNGLIFSFIIGVLVTAFAYCLLLKGLKHISSAKASTLSLAEPMGAACFGIILLGEHFSLSIGLGILFILGGVILLTCKTKE